MLLLLLAGSCAGRRAADTGPAGGPEAAVFKVRLDEGAEGKVRRFRLLLYAESPDRLHAEVVSAVGTTPLIVDAGGGRISVLFVRERVAYVGPSDGAALEGLLGLRLGVAELVGALLAGRAPPSPMGLERDPDGPGLPQRLLFTDPPRSMSMELKRRRPLRVDPETLCRGEPPPDVEIRPLDEIEGYALPGVETEENDP